MKRRVVNNYKIIENNNNDLSNASKIPKVTKNSKISLSDKIQLHQSLNETKKVINEVKKSKKPIIKINKNEDGVITSIDIKCEDPASFTLDFDYS